MEIRITKKGVTLQSSEERTGLSVNGTGSFGYPYR